MIRQNLEQLHDTEKWFKEMERDLNDFFGGDRQENRLIEIWERA